MSESGAGTPAPISPSVIAVSDLGATCRALGLPQPSDGATTVEVELLPGCVAVFAESTGTPTSFVYACTADIAAARRHVEAVFGEAQLGPDSVDPESLRTRGCVLRFGDLIIEAVHCPQAESDGVPCQEDCSPFAGFE